MKHGRLGLPATVLEFPLVLSFVVGETWVVVSFVENFENGREDLRFFLRKVDPSSMGLLELASTRGGEKGRLTENVLVGGEQPLFATADDGDDGGREVATGKSSPTIRPVTGVQRSTLAIDLTYLAKGGLVS